MPKNHLEKDMKERLKDQLKRISGQTGWKVSKSKLWLRCATEGNASRITDTMRSLGLDAETRFTADGHKPIVVLEAISLADLKTLPDYSDEALSHEVRSKTIQKKGAEVAKKVAYTSVNSKSIDSIDDLRQEILKMRTRQRLSGVVRTKVHIKIASIKQIKTLISNIHEMITTSNDIVPRVEYPYYHSHSSVPPELNNFKKRLSIIRAMGSELIADIKQIPASDGGARWNDLSKKSFFHRLVGTLASSAYGIGDCSECSTLLFVEMLKNGYGNLAFVSIRFLKAKEGMDQNHQFVVANLPKLPKPANPKKITIDDLFDCLPKKALIADPFLNLCFKPSEVPEDFRRYIDVYGGETAVIDCFHLSNFAPRMIRAYEMTAEYVVAQLGKLFPEIKHYNHYPLEDKIELENETSIISWLKHSTQLPFFAVRDQDYKVDAVVSITSESEQNACKQLKQKINGYGRFFCSTAGAQHFVIEGVNITNEKFSVGALIRSIGNTELSESQASFQTNQLSELSPLFKANTPDWVWFADNLKDKARKLPVAKLNQQLGIFYTEDMWVLTDNPPKRLDKPDDMMTVNRIEDLLQHPNRNGIEIRYMNPLLGYGAFARKAYKIGDIVALYSGQIKIQQKEDTGAPTKIFTQNLAASEYSLECGEADYIIDASTFRGAAGFFQHAPENPNYNPFLNIPLAGTTKDRQVEYAHIQLHGISEEAVAWSNVAQGPCMYQGYPLIGLIANRAIKKSEPLCLSYGYSYWFSQDRYPTLFTRRGELLSKEQYSRSAIVVKCLDSAGKEYGRPLSVKKFLKKYIKKKWPVMVGHFSRPISCFRLRKLFVAANALPAQYGLVTKNEIANALRLALLTEFANFHISTIEFYHTDPSKQSTNLDMVIHFSKDVSYVTVSNVLKKSQFYEAINRFRNTQEVVLTGVKLEPLLDECCGLGAEASQALEISKVIATNNPLDYSETYLLDYYMKQEGLDSKESLLSHLQTQVQESGKLSHNSI